MAGKKGGRKRRKTRKWELRKQMCKIALLNFIRLALYMRVICTTDRFPHILTHHTCSMSTHRHQMVSVNGVKWNYDHGWQFVNLSKWSLNKKEKKYNPLPSSCPPRPFSSLRRGSSSCVSPPLCLGSSCGREKQCLTCAPTGALKSNFQSLKEIIICNPTNYRKEIRGSWEVILPIIQNFNTKQEKRKGRKKMW